MAGSNARGWSWSGVLALVAGGVCAGGVHGAVLNWNNAGGGTFSTAANWNPVQAPVAGDDLVFNLAGVYSLTTNSSSPTSQSMAIRNGVTTLQINGLFPQIPGVHTTGLLTVSSSVSTINPSVTVSRGTLNASTLSVGTTTGGTSTMVVNGATVTSVNTISVGAADTGILNIVNGGLVQTPQGVNLGTLAGIAIGTVTVDGVSASNARSSLEARFATLAGAGDGTMNVLNGAHATFSERVLVAGNASTSAAMVVGGAGGAGPQVRATVDIGTDLLIGINTLLFAPGPGDVTVNNNGVIDVADEIAVGGDPQGGAGGVLRINAGGNVIAGRLTCGAGGDLQHIGGTLSIDGGAFVFDALQYSIGNTLVNDPQLVLVNGASLDATGAINGDNALQVGSFVGGAGSAGVSIESGSDVRVVASSAIAGSVFANIGADNDDAGDVTVTGIGSTLTASSTGSQLNVGKLGDGVLNVLSGGLAAFEILNVAADAGSTGTMTIDGAGSLALGRSKVNIGGDTTQGGTGQVIVRNGGELQVTQSTLEGVVIFGTGTLQVDSGGAVDVPGAVAVRNGGEIGMNGGRIDANQVLLNGGSLTALGASQVNAQIGASNGSVLVTGGTAVLGDAINAAGVNTEGSTLRVEAGTTTLRDSNQAFLGSIEMAGGTLAAPNDIVVQQVSLFSGFGTIDADISVGPAPTMTPSGSGFVFQKRTVFGTPHTYSGSAVRIASTGVLSAADQDWNMKFTADAGSRVETNTNLTLGDNTTTGVTLNGTVHIGNGTDIANEFLTLRDSNGVALGTLTTLAGGDLTCAAGIVLNSGRVLRGEGDINTNSLSIFGTIDPDNFDGPQLDAFSGIGTFDVSGNVTMGVNSRYLCEIAFFDVDPGDFNDVINIGGSAALGGTLEILPLPTYDPASCHSFTIMRYASKTGNFSSVIAPPGYAVVVEPTRVRVLLTDIGCDSIDFNGNGVFPEDADVIDFFNVLAGGVCPTGNCQSIDFNNNCVFPEDQDVIDYFTVLAGGACSV